MSLTPRQLAAYIEFNQRIDRMERANDVMVAAVGAQGDQKTVDKLVRELSS